jgi:hypothetical protein
LINLRCNFCLNHLVQDCHGGAGSNTLPKEIEGDEDAMLSWLGQGEKVPQVWPRSLGPLSSMGTKEAESGRKIG